VDMNSSILRMSNVWYGWVTSGDAMCDLVAYGTVASGNVWCGMVRKCNIRNQR